MGVFFQHGKDWMDGVSVPLLSEAPDWARCMRQAIVEIAEAEKRAPHEVLSEIAADQIGGAAAATD